MFYVCMRNKWHTWLCYTHTSCVFILSALCKACICTLTCGDEVCVRLASTSLGPVSCSRSWALLGVSRPAKWATRGLSREKWAVEESIVCFDHEICCLQSIYIIICIMIYGEATLGWNPDRHKVLKTLRLVSKSVYHIIGESNKQA